MLFSKEQKEILQPDRNTTGVVVARFQVDKLHQGQIDLLKTVIEKHKTVIIFLGISPLLGNKQDPLDYVSRALMLRNTFTEAYLESHSCNLLIDKISDQRDDNVWSKDLDCRIREISPRGKVTLYGSRDSFLAHYFGSHKDNVVELEPTVFTSGTEVRRDICAEVKADPMFRRGVIHGTSQRYDSGQPTIDVAILKLEPEKKITSFLMVRKANEELLRFCGGFFDSRHDKSYEQTARRETQEETSVEIADLEYIGSLVIDDWRYRGSNDKIITTFFLSAYVFGAVRPKDEEIGECQWISVKELWDNRKFLLTPEHLPLLEMLREKKPLLFTF